MRCVTRHYYTHPDRELAREPLPCGDDALGPARGILTGLALSILLLSVLFLVAWP